MAKTRYSIKEGQRINYKKLGVITNANLTDEIAEALLKTGQYGDIIQCLDTNNNSDKSSKNVDKK